MRVAVAYLTKDRYSLSRRTMPALVNQPFDVFWVDGSTDYEAQQLPFKDQWGCKEIHTAVRGGADAAIVFALTKMLEGDYDVVGLCENDVLLHDGWFNRTMGLFERGAEEGLVVGAVSPRCYDDRILIQRPGYAICHNLGAGVVLYTRKAARLILDHYRSAWWPDNRSIFAQLSGVDIGRYAAFRGEARWLTADWGFDAILSQHGLASLALTPCAAEMIGQEPSIEEQGLRLVDREVEQLRNDKAFHRFAGSLDAICDGIWQPQTITPIHRASMNGGASLIFPHQFDAKWEGEWRLKWSQGFGPFSWRATGSYETGQPSCHCWVQIFGPCIILVSGGERAAKIHIRDHGSGYEIDPEVPPAEHGITQLAVPGGVSYREIEVTCGEGAVFYGIQTQEPQPISNRKFDYSVLPPV